MASDQLLEVGDANRCKPQAGPKRPICCLPALLKKVSSLFIYATQH